MRTKMRGNDGFPAMREMRTMKTTEVARMLSQKAEAGDSIALAALLVSYRLSELDDRLMAIDGVLTEIRRAIQEQ